MSSLVIVARFASRSEVLIAQSLLRSEGIETLMPEFNVLMAELDPSMMEHGADCGDLGGGAKHGRWR